MIDLPWADLRTRYLVGLRAESAWAIAAVLGFTLLAVAIVYRRGRDARWVTALATAVVVAGAGAWAWHLVWLSDDAFISFRYARNLVEGHGLVFNPGERVEGYTNFLWTLAIAAALKLGVAAPTASVVLSLGAFALLLIVATELVRKHAPEGTTVSVSFAAIALGANYIVASYATSGLETMLGAALALLAVERAEANRPFSSGLAAILATLAHPDHAIFYATIAFVLLMDGERRRGLLRYAAPFVLVFVPYFAWRASYYGDFFPNTYYAKSANLKYFTQGWLYVAVTVVGGGFFAALPLALVGAAAHHRRVLVRYTVLTTLVFVYYVAKIGGDFMLGRLLVPLAAPLFILAELGARWLLASRRRSLRLLAFPGVAAFALTAVPVKIIGHLEKAWLIADERTFYGVKSFNPLIIESVYQDWGEDLNRFVVARGLDPHVAISSVGIAGYIANVRMIDTYGLTDRTVARQRLFDRGRPGHEKVAAPGYLATRGVDMSELPIYPDQYLGLTQLFVDGLRYYMPRYRRSFADALRGQREVSFTDFPAFLDRYDPFQPQRTTDALLCDLWFARQYYFQHDQDAERLRVLIAKIVRAEPSLAGLETFLASSEAPTTGWERVRTFDFESAEGWTATGAAFRRFPAETEAAGQTLVVGREGKFATSFPPRAGDSAMGVLESPTFEVAGDVITLEVGGGIHPDHLRVSLMVDGQRTFSTTGCQSEMLARRVWNVASLRGSRAQITVVDEAEYGWGHIVVDSITEWRRTAAPAASH